MLYEAIVLCASGLGVWVGCYDKEMGVHVILWLICMFLWGSIDAHNEVATECKTVGTFYVGHEVFECKKVKR